MGILICVVIVISIIAAGLPNLQFHPGSLGMGLSRLEPNTPSNSFIGSFLFLLFRITIGICIILGPIILIFGLGTPGGRRIIIGLVCMVIILSLLIEYFPRERHPLQRFQDRQPLEGIYGDAQSALNEGKNPIPPNWLVFLSSFLLSAIILGVMLFLWHRFRRRAHPLDLVAREAKKALDTINAGGDLKEGVVRYYCEMVRVVSKEKGLKRQHAMTTREFEKYLESMGLPVTHIRRLTRLFEKVRYGTRNLSKDEDNEAVSCLWAIVQACEGS
jgi:hypothetical protein